MHKRPNECSKNPSLPSRSTRTDEFNYDPTPHWQGKEDSTTPSAQLCRMYQASAGKNLDDISDSPRVLIRNDILCRDVIESTPVASVYPAAFPTSVAGRQYLLPVPHHSDLLISPNHKHRRTVSPPWHTSSPASRLSKNPFRNKPCKTFDMLMLIMRKQDKLGRVHSMSTILTSPPSF